MTLRMVQKLGLLAAWISPVVAAAQNPVPAADLRFAALRAVHAASSGAKLVVVHEAKGDTIAMKEVARRTAAAVRTVEQSRSCSQGPFPQCPWTLGDDSIAVRLTVEREDASVAIVLVASWGSVKQSNGIASGFFEETRVFLEKRGNAWVVVRRQAVWST